jgi:TPR repeat protein
MHTKNLLLSSLIIFLINATIAGELNTTLPSGYLKKEPAEKEIWYSGLVTKAIIFYGQSCANGESKGCFNLGLIYDTGEPAVQDKAKAISSYKKACEADSSLACNNLGILYADGDGVDRDYSIAINYFDMSCKMNEEVGCKNREIAKDQENAHKR